MPRSAAAAARESPLAISDRISSPYCSWKSVGRPAGMMVNEWFHGKHQITYVAKKQASAAPIALILIGTPKVAMSENTRERMMRIRSIDMVALEKQSARRWKPLAGANRGLVQ